MFTRTLLSAAGTLAIALAGLLPIATQAAPVAHKFSDLKSIQVENDKGEKLGMIEDLVYDPTTGQIRYAALEFGGFLGIIDAPCEVASSRNFSTASRPSPVLR